ncbi:hypothetical protein [[Kitasatospora] papulosa]|uniref:hypothetical protein n=1 Tax=[Kitasatospora] papulosa TaxID=1464011 RepID=UPI00371E63C3
MVTALVAAIALAGRGGVPGDDPANAGDGPRGVISSEPARSTHGAQRAAVAIASATGSEVMFSPEARHALVKRIAHPDVESKLQKEYDAPYARLNPIIGLNADGKAPAGTEFVSRTMPAGTAVTEYSPSQAVVEVWAHGILDLSGTGPAAAKDEPSDSWFTVTVSLRWHRGEWKMLSTEQTKGPTPDEAQPGDFGQAPPL